MQLRTSFFIYATGLLVGIVTLFFLLFMRSSADIEPQIGKYSESYWSARIATIGADAAYQEMASLQITDGRVFSRRVVLHVIDHAFGSALYDTRFSEEGFAALRVCDPLVFDGCMHEFMGRVFSDNGPSILSEAKAVCSAETGMYAWTACFHAIGHGITAYLGYSTDNMREGLAMCKSAFEGEALEQCYSGVLMEYNERLVASDPDTGPTYREISAENPFEPCDTLSDARQKRACVLRQVRLWVHVSNLSGPESKSAEIASQRCREAPKTMRGDCFEGIGKTPWGVTGANAKSVCTSASDDQQDRLNCLTGAAYYYMYRTEGRDENAGGLCDPLPSVLMRECLSKAKAGLSGRGIPPEMN